MKANLMSSGSHTVLVCILLAKSVALERDHRFNTRLSINKQVALVQSTCATSSLAFGVKNFRSCGALASFFYKSFVFMFANVF
jgi:hypothetical protein